MKTNRRIVISFFPLNHDQYINYIIISYSKVFFFKCVKILFVKRLAKSLLTVTVQKSDLRSDHQGCIQKPHDFLLNSESERCAITALLSVCENSIAPWPLS